MVAAMALDAVVTPAISAVAPDVGLVPAAGRERTPDATADAGRTGGP